MRYASLRRGLVGCWCPSVSGPFGYRLPDLSGYGNHGTLTNMDPGSDWVVSGGKGALDFDGSNDYVAATSRTETLNSFTASCWGSISNIFGLRMWFTRDTDATNGRTFILGVVNGSYYCSVFDSSNTEYGLSFGNPGLNAWTCFSIIWIPGTLSAYINGSKVATRAAGSTMQTNNTTNINIGRRSYTGFLDYFQGYLDDCRIYNRALTESEIRLLASERGIGLKPERQRNRYLVPTPSRNRSSRFLGFPS